MDADRSNGVDRSCCLAFSILYLKNARRAHRVMRSAWARARRTICVPGYLLITTFTRTIKGRNCILRKTRAIKVCSARTGADIQVVAARSLLRYSRGKSLPNPLRVHVPASGILYRYVRVKRKYKAQETRILEDMRAWGLGNYH